MMVFLKSKTTSRLIILFLVSAFILFYISGYRFSASEAAKAHFEINGKDAQHFDEIELGWGTVFLFNTEEGPHTVLSLKKYGLLWRAPASTWAYNVDDLVKTVGGISYSDNHGDVTVFAVQSSDPDVAYIEAGPLPHRTREKIEADTPVVLYWPGVAGININQLNAVALSAEGEKLYEYRYPEGNVLRQEELRFYPINKGILPDNLQQVQVKMAEEEEPTAEELGINYRDYNLAANYIVKTLFEFDPEIIGGDLKKLKESYTIQGKYDLNSDGKSDVIQVYFSALSAASSTNKISTIKVNDAEVKVFFDNPQGVYISELNKDDRFKELIVFDDGPSGDPEIFLYRYNGIEVVELGNISGDIGIWLEKSSNAIRDEDLIVEASGYTGPYYGAIKTDGLGSILSPNNVVEFISPEIILGIYEIKEEEVKHTKIDYSRMLNREYEIKEDFRTYFKETEKDLNDSVVMSWDKEYMISLKKGEKIFFEEIAQYGARYLVKLQNGKKGILYFWAGD